MMTHRLILLRHGLSEFSRINIHSGWHDSPLSEDGRGEARDAAAMMASAELAPTVLHTSRLDRAIETAEIALRELRRSWVDVRRTWRLNALHWGDFTGLDKGFVQAHHGVTNWRNEFMVAKPPPVQDDNEFNPNVSPMYRDLPPGSIPRHESLTELKQRVLPYWYDAIVPDLHAGHTVFVVASGIPLTVLMELLDGTHDDFTADGRIATAIPFVYELDSDMTPVAARHPLERALDPEAAANHYARTAHGGWSRDPTDDAPARA